MLDYEAIFEECKTELRRIGVPIAEDDKITLDITLYASCKAEGYCHRQEECFVIRLKRAYFTCKTPDMQHLRSLMMHELVHTCPGSFYDKDGWNEHPAQFVEYAKLVYDRLHLHILETEALASYRAGNESIKIKMECPNCHYREIFRSEKDIQSSAAARNTMKYGFHASFCQYCGNVTARYLKMPEEG